MGSPFAMKKYEADMIDTLARLCRIPSVKGEALPGAPYGENTRMVLEEFLEIGRNLGFKCTNLDNRAGFAEFGSTGKLVAVLAHLDVVPAGSAWTSDPWQPIVEDDKIIARGTIDDKGPAVAVLFAMKSLMDEGFQPRGRIRLIVGLDEESGSTCMDYYREKSELPAAGFTPDAEFPVIYAEKGIAWLKISLPVKHNGNSDFQLTGGLGGNRPNMVPDSCELHIRDKNIGSRLQYSGVSAHASKPWEGSNAISRAMADISSKLIKVSGFNSFVAFYSKYVGETWDGNLLGIAEADDSGPLTLNPGQLVLENDMAELTFDMRYPVSSDFTHIMETLKSIIIPLGGNIDVIEHLPPLFMPPESELVSSLMSCYRETTGFDHPPKAIGGGTYARSMPNIVAFGPTFPGDPEMAHRADEYISLDTLIKSAEIYKNALRRLSS